MALVSVTFSITAEAIPALSGDPLENAIVRVFSEDGSVFVTQGSTDANGELVLDLEDATTYWVRFFKEEYAFDPRLTIDVDSGASSNTFDVEGQYLSENLPSASNYLCRITGYVGGAAWAPVPGVTFTFSMTGKPRIVAGRIMAIGDLIVESDADGWVDFEIARNVSYDCVVAGMEDEVFRVMVPDKDACSITDLVWPYVAELAFSPTSISVAEGEETDVDVTVTLSSGVETPFELDDDDFFVPGSYLSFEVADGSVASVEWSEDGSYITISGGSAGSTTLSAELIPDIETERAPEPARSFAELSITVTG